jgi:hypothetical protein
MVERRGSPQELPKSKRPPGTTPEAQENRLVALAVDRAEQQLRDGTASAQVITHFLKLGSTRERLEQARLEHEVALLEAKKEQMASSSRIEELYNQAIGAFRGYRGEEVPDEFEDQDL